MSEPVLNFFENYVMMAVLQEVVPKASFFKDRYFGNEVCFDADKVLVEYMKGDRKMAPFVVPRIGDIEIAREGYSIREYQPARISISRGLTADELTKRGFGEALYPGSNAAERAAKLLKSDFETMNNRICRREEWMAVQTMLNNGCTMQEYVDGKTVGNTSVVRFYDEATSPHLYTVANKWDTADADILGDGKNMIRMLKRRGLPAVDMILGEAAGDAFMENAKIKELLNKNLAIEIGALEAKEEYPGTVRIGSINFGGTYLNVWISSETYEDESGVTQYYFPTNGCLVTAPNCGQFLYGAITQIDYGKEDYTTYAKNRVSKFMVNQPDDTRKTRLATRPLAAPINHCPYIFAADVCSE